MQFSAPDASNGSTPSLRETTSSSAYSRGGGIFNVKTKASEITSLDAFYVSAVTGGAGSETAAFTNRQFTKVAASDPACYTSTEVWPASDPGYAFYASNVPLTYTASGATVNATNVTDVVCAYLPTSTYRYANTLTFEHVFARLGTVTVVAAPSTTVWDVSISITPKTGGTYNLRTKEWSSLTTGSATQVASAVDANANDLWLVPGTYTLTASWTVRPWGGAAEQHTNIETEITVEKGKTTAVSCMLGSGIQVGIDLERFESADIINPPTFAGLMICPAPLYYDGEQGFMIKDYDWNHTSHGEKYGKVDGSYYFSFYDLASYFDSRGDSFTSSSGSIDNLGNKISWGGYDDWRLATKEEWDYIIEYGWLMRPGSIVDDMSNITVLRVRVLNTPGISGDYVSGALYFPDNLDFHGFRYSKIVDNDYCLSKNTLSSLLAQGCFFLPNNSLCNSSGVWSTNGYYGALATEGTSTSSWAVAYHYHDSSLDKNNYIQVFLVRQVSDFSESDYVQPEFFCNISRTPGEDVILMQNKDNNGLKYGYEFDKIDFSKGDYIETKFDLSNCDVVKGEIIGFGEDIGVWSPSTGANAKVCFPMPDDDRRIRITFRGLSGNTEDLLYDISDEQSVTIRLDKDGLWLDGSYIDDRGYFYHYYLNGLVSNFYVGSYEGSNRSFAHYDYIKVHFAPEGYSDEFTINASGDKVRFSRGNLWAHISAGPDATGYNYTADQWGFFSNQWEHGPYTFEIGSKVSYFGWVGLSATYDNFGLSTSEAKGNSDYGTSEFDTLKTDWGNIPGVVAACGDGWFTPTVDQLDYLVHERLTGGSVAGTPDARFALAKIRTDVSAVNGIILFPDGVSFDASEFVSVGALNVADDYGTECTASQWTALEAKGCVFLPSTYYRAGTNFNPSNMGGDYWTSSTSNAYFGNNFAFWGGNSPALNCPSDCWRYKGINVRLVRAI